jgi:hypothetical protein
MMENLQAGFHTCMSPFAPARSAPVVRGSMGEKATVGRLVPLRYGAGQARQVDEAVERGAFT